MTCGPLLAWALDPKREPKRDQVELKRSITIGPFMGFFFNRNTTMQLRGHGHSCSVELEYTTVGETGFPAFEGTYKAVQQRVTELLTKPFRDHTNEAVADHLWDGLVDWTHPELERWGGQYQLARMTLGVLGVPDDIGHADGWTYYTVQRG